MDRAHRNRIALLVIAGIVLILATTLPTHTSAQTATPIPPHESPKSPRGNEGATAMIALIAVALIAGGITWGSLLEQRRQVATPAPPRDTAER